MANKCRLKVTVLGILLAGLAGCQMLTDGYDQVQARAEIEAETANRLPVQRPAIEDAEIQGGWEYLRGLQDPIGLPDGTQTSGQKLAQFLLEEQIPVVWGSDAICGGSSCSRMYCGPDGHCSYEDGQPGIDPIYLNSGIASQGEDITVRLARELGHEAFHRMQFFGKTRITQVEEFWAFYLDTQLAKADWPRFEECDPQDPEQLQGWFYAHGMHGYLQLAPYPGSAAQASQDAQAGQALEIE